MKKILLVEDNEYNITMMLSILGEAYDISVSTSAEDALSIIHQELPDLMIIDLYLEGMNGLEFCRAVKNSDYTASIPVIVLTAATNPCIIEEVYKAGAELFMGKPYRPHLLLENIEKLIACSRSS